LCKVFPAKELGGSSFIKAVDPAIHKLISLVPTGGTNAQNIPDYIDAGVLVLGGSFSAIEKSLFAKIVEQQDYKLLTSELKKTKELIDSKRSQKWPKLDFVKASIEQISRVTGRNFNV
jgi:2-keto-3-deoxy-6-phosphogluconate aldolase